MEKLPITAFQSICRTCLSYSDRDLYPIEDIEMENKKLLEILYDNLPLYFPFLKQDRAPQNMCRQCILKIYEVHRFLKDCKDSQQYLCSIIKTDQRKHTDTLVKLEENTFKSNERTDIYSVNCAYVFPSTYELYNANSFASLNCGIVYSNSSPSFLINKANLFNTDSANLSNEISSDTPLNQVIKEDNFDIDDHSVHSDDLSCTSKISEKELSLPEKPNLSSTPDRTRKMPVHKCQVCSEVLCTNRQLQAHWVRYDHFPDKYRCHYCQRGFAITQRLEYHIRTHTGERPYVCDICGQTFSHPSSRARHKMVHTGEKKYTCDECGKKFNRKEFLLEHERRFHNRDKLLCGYCGKAFCNRSALSVHEATHVQPQLKIDPNIPFQCNVCGKILANQDVLDKHKEHHPKEKVADNIHLKDSGSRTRAKRLYCRHCNTDFNTWAELRQHKLHSKCSEFFEHYTCEVCGKFSFSKATLYVHQKVHKDEAENITYKCNICEEEFKRHTHYKQHLAKHTRQRTHICAECGFQFYKKQHLDNHKRIHTGERPFICSICNKSFSFKVNLYHHRKLHTVDKTLKCEFCGNLFRSASELKKHTKRRHRIVKTEQ